MVVTLEKRSLGLAVLLVALFVGVLIYSPRVPQRIPPEAVWREAVALGARHDLNPNLIVAIAFAESSFNAHADSGFARGLMQMSRAAWSDTTSMPYERAFQWRHNMAVATAFLAALRDRLVVAGHYDDRTLAAAYRHGFAALARERFAVSRMPKAQNAVYAKIFAGHLPPPTDFGVPAERVAAIPQR